MKLITNNEFAYNVLSIMRQCPYLRDNILYDRDGTLQQIEGLRTIRSYELFEGDEISREFFADNESHGWHRIRTFNRLAFMHWVFSDECKDERQLFIDAGVGMSFDKSWSWNTPWKTYNHLSGSDTRHNTAYQIMFSKGGQTRYDNITDLSNPIRFYDQCLFSLVEKIRTVKNPTDRYTSCGSYHFTSDGVLFGSSRREDCELVKIIWDCYGGDVSIPIMFSKYKGSADAGKQIAIGQTAIDCVIANRDIYTTKNQPQEFQYEFSPDEILHIING